MYPTPLIQSFLEYNLNALFELVHLGHLLMNGQLPIHTFYDLDYKVHEEHYLE